MWQKIKNNGNGVERNSAIELLRIIAMIMIVFSHFAYHGKFSYLAWPLPRCWYNFIIMGGKIGVNIFVLITGYFLIEKTKGFNLKKILKLWGQVFFYSIAIFVIVVYTKSILYFVYHEGSIDITIKDTIGTFFPISFSKWWFVSSYFVLYLLYPFINKLLHNLSQKEYQNLIIIFLITLSVIPTLTNDLFVSSNLLWFIALYCLAGYIKLYGLSIKLKTKHYIIIWVVTVILVYLSYFKFESMLYQQERIPMLIISVCMFMVFKNTKMNYHKWVNTIASAAFGVYLIHDNEYVRTFLWETVFKQFKYYNSAFLVPYSFFAVFTVFFACTFIDLVRQKTVERLYMKMIDRKIDKITAFGSKIIGAVKKIVF